MVMKKTLLISATALMLSVCAFAQGNGQRPPREKPDEATMVKMRTEHMVKQLELDETQAAKLLELNQKYPQMMMGGPGGHGGPGGPGMGRLQRDGQRPEAKADTQKPKKENKVKKDRNDRPQMTEEQMEKMKADREAYEAELKGILTEEQFKTWKEDRGRRPQRPDRSF
jgi:Spy/CpxP family protein refolding chaperone